jgi:hypothetical protein
MMTISNREKGSSMRILYSATDLTPPAYIGSDGRLEWWVDGSVGVRHRVGGPAVIKPNGSQEWWVNGQLHRVGGPACSYADGRQEWRFHGQLHRADGPAVYYVIEDSIAKESWFWFGEQVPEDHHAILRALGASPDDDDF